jgi:hypothetical protein
MSFHPRQTPPVGVDPQNIYRQPVPNYAQTYFSALDIPEEYNHDKMVYAPVEPAEPNSNIYGAVYSGVPVFEMMCRSVAVMRRRSDSYLNATQILKVAGSLNN